jgi:hypothetical protein
MISTLDIHKRNACEYVGVGFLGNRYFVVMLDGNELES